MKQNFSKQIFNETEYLRRKNELEGISEKVTTGVTALRQEGLPITPEFVTAITANETAFRNYVRNLADEKIGKGFIPMDEKARIYDSYNQLLNRNNDKVQAMRKSLESGQLKIVFEKSTVKIDWAAIEKEARAVATHTIDTESMQGYFDEVVKLKGAIEAFRAYEEKNGLPDFIDKGLYYGSPLLGSGFRNRMKFFEFLEKQGDSVLFEEIAQDYFEK